MMQKIKSALTTLFFLVLIGLIILGSVIFFQNLSVIINKFMDTPIEFIVIFFLGALSHKLSQILRICRAKKIRVKKIEKARRKAIAAARAKAKAMAQAEPSPNVESNTMDENDSETQAEPSPNMDESEDENQ